MVEVLVEARIATGLSQRKFSTKIKRPKTFMQTVESMERTVSVPEFMEMAEACDKKGSVLMRRIERRLAEDKKA